MFFQLSFDFTKELILPTWKNLAVTHLTSVFAMAKTSFNK